MQGMRDGYLQIDFKDMIQLTNSTKYCVSVNEGDNEVKYRKLCYGWQKGCAAEGAAG